MYFFDRDVDAANRYELAGVPVDGGYRGVAYHGVEFVDRNDQCLG